MKQKRGVPHRVAILASVICAHRNNLETHKNDRRDGAHRKSPVDPIAASAPRRHPSLTKCELAEGSSAAPRQLPAVVIYGARLAGLGELEFQRERREVGIAN